jgi:hypothetical protein
MSVTVTQPQTAEEWIDLYLNLGFVMFPVTQEKIPPGNMTEWEKFLETPMKKEMLLYYVEKRGFNLAAITSDKTFYVVDDDYPKHPDSSRPGGSEMDSTIVAKTQNGGFHYYYKPFGMRNKQNIKLSKTEKFHIDLRGNSPGYVLVPPFGGYEWVKPPTRQALENLPEKPPEAIMNIWNSKKEMSPNDIGTDDFFDVIGVSEFRDPILFERSFVLWQNHFKNPTHYTPAYIASILRDFNENFSPPKGADVVKKCYEQGKRYAQSWARESGIIKVQQEIPRTDLSNLTDEELQSYKQYPELKTGIEQLDKGGVPSGMLLLIGQSGAGKSWFMNHIVRSSWELNKLRSVVFSLEMDTQGLTRRMLQSYSGMTATDIKYGGKPDKGIKVIRDAKPVIIDYTQVDRDAITPLSLTQAVHEYYAMGYRVFLLDHFHEIPGASTNDKNQQVTEIWGDVFKAIRNTYDDVWLFVLVQSNKEGYKKEILTKENTSGSSALYNKCDYFLSLNRKEKPDSNLVLEMDSPKKITLWVDKNRRGFADRFAVPCLLDNTGSFKETSTQLLKEAVDPEEKEKMKYWK